MCVPLFTHIGDIKCIFIISFHSRSKFARERAALFRESARLFAAISMADVSLILDINAGINCRCA